MVSSKCNPYWLLKKNKESKYSIQLIHLSDKTTLVSQKYCLPLTWSLCFLFRFTVQIEFTLLILACFTSAYKLGNYCLSTFWCFRVLSTKQTGLEDELKTFRVNSFQIMFQFGKKGMVALFPTVCHIPSSMGHVLTDHHQGKQLQHWGTRSQMVNWQGLQKRWKWIQTRA